ncbi:MAG: HWE histidine kinase domain-containing protein [Pseudomonadota bacterium]
MSKVLPIHSYTAFSSDEMEVGLQVARVGLGTVDYRRDTLRLDPLCGTMFDLPAGLDLPRDTLHKRIHPEDWPAIEAEVETLLDPSEDNVLDMTHRILTPSGDVRWVNARKKVRFDGSAGTGLPVSGVFAVVDITARVQAEHREKILLGELGHRAKNLFTVVLGVARQLKRFGSTEDFVDRFTRRLEALARNQDAIASGANGNFDLTEIIRQQLVPFEGETQSRVHITGRSFVVAPDAAQIVAMVTHELLTNAIKYGALSTPDGWVDVSLDRDEGKNKFILRWQEDGGPEVRAPNGEGYGTKVLVSLAKVSLQGEIKLDYAPGGFRYELKTPLSRMRPPPVM